MRTSYVSVGVGLTAVLHRVWPSHGMTHQPRHAARDRHRSLLLSLLAAFSVSTLVACGGGGGGVGGAGGDVAAGSGSTAIKTPQTPTGPADDAGDYLPSTIVKAVATANYRAGSESAQAYALLNAERARCGFGLLRQNAALDTAARDHAGWLILNNQMRHDEVPGTPGFTGASPLDRVTAAGYNPGVVSDEISGLYYSGSTQGTGEFGVRALLALPYHQISMLGGYLDVGLSMRGSDRLGTTQSFGPRSVQQFDLGFQASEVRQEPASDEVLTYPCDGTTGVFYEMTNETPNPVPGRDLLASPLGSSILVSVRSGQALAITSATMKTRYGNTPVALRPTMTRDNDPNAILQSHQALIVPDHSLLPSTDYVVKIVGSNDGVAFTRTISFATGTGAAH